MFAEVNPLLMALESAHSTFHGRKCRITPLTNELQMADVRWVDDSPGFEGRNSPEIVDRFFVFGNPASDFRWLSTELFYRVEQLRKYRLAGEKIIYACPGMYVGPKPQ